jgi:hypothetical protein
MIFALLRLVAVIWFFGFLVLSIAATASYLYPTEDAPERDVQQANIKHTLNYRLQQNQAHTMCRDVGTDWNLALAERQAGRVGSRAEMERRTAAAHAGQRRHAVHQSQLRKELGLI